MGILLTKSFIQAYSDFAEAYEVPSDPSTRGLHFYNEAKRCFEQEDGHSTLATVQGLAVLSTWYDLICL